MLHMAKNPTSKYSKDFISKTIQVWQPYSPIPLSLKDAREITENMTALFNFLISEEKNPAITKRLKAIVLSKEK